MPRTMTEAEGFRKTTIQASTAAIFQFAMVTLPMGPVASQESIKELGTNGGGFFNANSAHPYENPTALSNFLEMLAMVLIPCALTYTFGRMVDETRQGWAVLAAMGILFVAMFSIANVNEQRGNPRLAALGIDQTASVLQPGGNMEGKEARLGVAASALFGTIATGTSTGAVNSMHDSFTPLGSLHLPITFGLSTGPIANPAATQDKDQGRDGYLVTCRR